MEQRDPYIDELLDKFSDCMAQGFIIRTREVGQDAWPSPRFHPVEGAVYAALPFLTTLEETLKALEEEGFTNEEIAQLFMMPSRIVRLTYLTMAYNIMNAPREKRIHITYKLLVYLSILRPAPFCEGGQNILLNTSELRDATEHLNFMTIGQKGIVGRTISQLSYLLSMYCELLYFCERQLGHEDHGPYKMNSGETLIIRDFYDLKPPFWRFTSSLPFEKLQIFLVYRDTDIRFDFSNRWHSQRPLKQDLCKFAVWNSQRGLSLDRHALKEYVEGIKETISQGIREIDALEDKMELIRKFGEKYFYAIKPLRNAIKRGWSPPESFYQSLKNRELKHVGRRFFQKNKETANLSAEERLDNLRQLIDPRQGKFYK